MRDLPIGLSGLPAPHSRSQIYDLAALLSVSAPPVAVSFAADAAGTLGMITLPEGYSLPGTAQTNVMLATDDFPRLLSNDGSQIEDVSGAILEWSLN